MKNLVLFLIAVLSLTTITPIAILYAFWTRTVDFMSYAISIDQSINSIGGELLCAVMLKDRNKNKFGDMDKTISYNLGKNKVAKNLTRFGLLICFLLHCVDKNHVERVFKDNV